MLRAGDPADLAQAPVVAASETTCSAGSWTEEDIRIGMPRMAMSDRAGRWVTEQVGQLRPRA